MRKLFLIAGVLFAATAQAGEGWSSLWRTDDQRGEQLLKKGDAASAAKTYADPHRKAYAELQAGDYAAAAKDFGSFEDSDAQYNRGNALAESGDLQEAVKAYEAALARDPKNKDAQHNRDLVQKALDEQQKKDQQQNQSQQDKQKGSDQNQQQSGGHGQPDKDQKQNASSQSKDSQGKSGQSQDDQKKDDQQQASDDKQSQAGKDGKQDASQQQAQSADAKDEPQSGDKKNEAAGKQDHHDQGSLAQSKSPSQKDQNGQSKEQSAEAAKDDADQARRDVQASAQKSGDGKDKHKGEVAQQFKNTVPDSTPRTEQQLAQEQWLRQIPDDPGGLLRRKFMIEHMLRQKQEEQQIQPQDQQP